MIHCRQVRLFILLFVLLLSGALAADIYVQKERIEAGKLNPVYVRTMFNESLFSLSINGEERKLYFSAVESNALVYVVYSGFDVQYFPRYLKVEVQSSLGTNKYSFRVHGRSAGLKRGRVSLNKQKKKLLSAKVHQRDENAFFHTLYRVETGERYFNGPWELPVTNTPGSPYGALRTYDNGRQSYHRGLDFPAIEGTSVYAPQSGKVLYVGKEFIRGNVVVIDHGSGIVTAYWHLSRIDVKARQRVRQGEIIGAVGSTGLSTGPHLHWDMRIKNQAVDAMSVFDVQWPD